MNEMQSSQVFISAHINKTKKRLDGAERKNQRKSTHDERCGGKSSPVVDPLERATPAARKIDLSTMDV
jgi:hypothetical protein